jgi:hypothetical protein
MEKQILELMDRFDEGNMSINDLEQELLVLYNVSKRNWAKMREDACRVREQVAINFMLEVYCDVEATDELKNEAYEDFKKRYVR